MELAAFSVFYLVEESIRGEIQLAKGTGTNRLKGRPLKTPTESYLQSDFECHIASRAFLLYAELHG